MEKKKLPTAVWIAIINGAVELGKYIFSALSGRKRKQTEKDSSQEKSL